MSSHDLEDSREVFIDYVISRYGDQMFRIPVEQLAEVLVDLQMQMDALDITWYVPSAVAEKYGTTYPIEGDVEMFIYPCLIGDFTVAIFPIYDGE
jgi:hypothetical protein